MRKAQFPFLKTMGIGNTIHKSDGNYFLEVDCLT